MIKTRNLVESLEKKYSIEKEEKRPLHESFVEEWWGQTDEDPFDFAYEYGLTCKKIGHNNDEDLYRFSGEKEDFDKARKDGYFYSLDFDADEGHSEDLNESKELNESTAGDIIWEKVRDVIREKIESEIIDNLAMVINSEVPEYNPDWCAESSNQSQWAADKLAEELATELMFELE